MQATSSSSLAQESKLELQLLAQVHVQSCSGGGHILSSNKLQGRMADAAPVPHEEHAHLHSTRRVDEDVSLPIMYRQCLGGRW